LIIEFEIGIKRLKKLIKELESMSAEIFDNSIYLEVRKFIEFLKQV